LGPQRRRFNRDRRRARIVELHPMIVLRKSLLVAAALVAAATAGCHVDVAQRGNLPTRAKLAELQPGRTTRDQVVKILGSPSSVSVFDDKSWYYISAREKQIAFLAPDQVDQQVYIVRFDDNGVVQSIDHKNQKDGRAIVPVARTTPAPGRQLSFMEQIIGNIGKFNSAGGGNDTAAGPSGPGSNFPGQ
jgi:outer membrane protein assembly factor BamE (lipoprotein component of BamABCDE complex)